MTIALRGVFFGFGCSTGEGGGVIGCGCSRPPGYILLDGGAPDSLGLCGSWGVVGGISFLYI